MNALIRVFSIFAAIPLVISGCAALPEQEERAVAKAAVHESLLGKPLSDEVVADFIANNECSSANQFLLCKTAGMALWTDSNEVVETVYLYLNYADGFESYKGELPFGLKFYDNMAAVQYKLGRQGLGNRGLPDEEAVPDHMHYQATYYEAGLTIIYNFPFPDEDATIYAIVVTNHRDPR